MRLELLRNIGEELTVGTTFTHDMLPAEDDVETEVRLRALWLLWTELCQVHVLYLLISLDEHEVLLLLLLLAGDFPRLRLLI